MCLTPHRLALAVALIACSCGHDSKQSKGATSAASPSGSAPLPKADWWEADKPCPKDTELQGGGPPRRTKAWCLSESGVLHGPATEWYASGGLRSRGYFAHGFPDGLWEVYWEEGNIRRRVSYRAGQIVGPIREYCEDGSAQKLVVGSAPCPNDTTSDAGEVGVTSCDAYIAKYRQCLRTKKTLQPARKRLETALENAVVEWKAQAQTDAGKKQLERSCRLAEEAARQALKTFGCDF